MNRREALAALASTTVLPFTSGCGAERAAVAPPTTSEADARALLDEIGDNLLRLSPESATSLGIDTGARADSSRAARRIAPRTASSGWRRS